MNVIFLFSGKQMEYIPKKREIFRVDYQKNLKPGNVFLIEKVLNKDNEFGQPFLNIYLRAEVLKHGLKKK